MYKITGEIVRRPRPQPSTNREESQLELVSTQTQLFNPAALFSDSREDFKDSAIIAVFDPDELSFELGVWLAGLESFLKRGDQTYSDKKRPTEAAGNWARECRLTRAALLNSSKLNFRLRKAVAGLKFSFEEFNNAARVRRHSRAQFPAASVGRFLSE